MIVTLTYKNGIINSFKCERFNFHPYSGEFTMTMLKSYRKLNNMYVDERNSVYQDEVCKILDYKSIVIEGQEILNFGFFKRVMLKVRLALDGILF